MQADQLKQRIHRVEECVDDAKNAIQQGQVPDELRQCVETLHRQARQAEAQAGQGQQMGQQQDQLRQAVLQMEQTADRAMEACRKAGNSVDPQTQQAHTAHTLNPVPLILYDNVSGGRLGLKQTETAGLSNLAATTANLLGFEKHPSWDESLLTVK